MQRGNGHYYIESSFSIFSNPPGVYNPPPVPGRPRWHVTLRLVGYPAGTRGDIQAVTILACPSRNPRLARGTRPPVQATPGPINRDNDNLTRLEYDSYSSYLSDPAPGRQWV